MTTSPRPVLPLPITFSGKPSWLAVLVVGSVFACYASATALWPGERLEELPALSAPASKAPLRQRCETCGVIESIRATEAADGRPAGWTFSIRLRDGSLRHSNGPLPGSWQVGESMQLIGGDRTWSQH